MKQMFDISAKLVSEQDEIYGVKTIDWENSSWKYLCLIGDEQVISLKRTKVYVFSDSVLCLGKIHENPFQTLHGNKRLEWFKSSPEDRNLDRIEDLFWNGSEGGEAGVGVEFGIFRTWRSWLCGVGLCCQVFVVVLSSCMWS